MFAPVKRQGSLLAVAAWLAGCALFAPPAARAADEEPLNTYSMGHGLCGQVFDDGRLVLTAPAADWSPLQVEILFPNGHNQRRFGGLTARRYSFLTSEGSVGGHRGFSARADDDGDGLRDEDPLDGKDNDGDGSVDEDFAAVSDAMSVVGRDRVNEAFHLACYKWAYKHLQSTLFCEIGASSDRTARTASSSGVWQLTTTGSDWYEIEAQARRHTTTGRPQLERTAAFISHLRVPAELDEPALPGGDASLWLGVVVLTDDADQHAPGHRKPLIEPDGPRLRAPLRTGPIPVAVCVAASWARLNTMLVEAQVVYRGATDPVSGQQVRWVVPALCSPCRMAEPPECFLSRTGAETLRLTARFAGDLPGLIDPDMFQLDGQRLGAPSSLLWLPAVGVESVRQSWSLMDPNLLHRAYDHLSDPYGAFPALLEHQADGDLVFTFDLTSLAAGSPLRDLIDDATAGAIQVMISGQYLDGRQFQLSPTVIAAATEPDLGSLAAGAMIDAAGHRDDRVAADQAALLHDRKRQPTLAADLLQTFPNPFSDATRIRFRVPQTIGEAFVWEDDEMPAGIDLAGSVPWRNGSPRVSVKIYSMTGQELVLLYSSLQDGGENVVQWSGNDAFGRPVASGTYFCKLQIDDWSVTRRIVYLR